MDKISIHKEGAVIVLRELSSDSLILTKRGTTMRYHPGEVCFPGGSWQEGDKDFYATALRELHEELGIQSSRVKLEKALDPEQTLGGYIIYPCLANIKKLIPYQLESHEVAEVFLLPMVEVINPSNYKEIKFERSGVSVKTYQFTASEFYVWGATARIMRQLVHIITLKSRKL